jgi:predicted  nucleic acid-binding Zn-ribbon protein
MPSRKKTTSATTGRSEKAALRVLTEKLAKQLLTRDAQATRAEEKNKDLKYQLEDLQNWSETAKKFIRNCKAEKLDMQNQFADRDRALVEREKKIKKREDEVEARVALLQTCAALEHELFIAKTQIKNTHSTFTETNKRAERREQELKFCKDEVFRLERTFVEHLHHVMKIQNETMSKIADDREIGSVQQSNENAKNELKTKIAIVCATNGAEKGTGLGKLADELVDSMTETFGKSASKAEELRNKCAVLEEQVNNLTINLNAVTKEKVHLSQKLRSEQLNLRQMCKRVDRLQRTEVFELRAMLEHSQKKYLELHGMLKEYLSFSQEEMERCLGFIPRTVSQVANVASNASSNPLEDFVGQTSY